ncbi:MAG: phosphopyruvate hydratase [Candidatus Kerfeldbacteria bacterium]|nr:phosphopyruvate hydratase [Candidatus Kerfeldbacteria bacterium]
MHSIQRLTAETIPDSRGVPTLETSVVLSDGTHASASVPSGTSTGRYEALELRDGDPAVAGGKGVTRAMANVNGELAAALKGQPADLPTIDAQLVALDGTPNKHRLGANALLSVSLALSRALSQSVGQPLYAYLAHVYGRKLPTGLPRPLVNVFEGGRHADTALSVQEFHIIPQADSTRQQMDEVRRAFDTLGTVLQERGLRVQSGMEGTYTAPLRSHEEVFAVIEEAIGRTQIAASLGIDAAASEFYGPHDNLYHLSPEGTTLNAEQLCRIYQSWISRFPLKLVEDPLNQDDWDGWGIASHLLSGSVAVIGDDFLTTNPTRIREAFSRELRIGVLLKPNQIGTVTETVQARELADEHQASTVMSNRSGETLDSFIADFAVALGVTYLKAGGPYAPERVAKYDRLVAIAEELHG